LGAYALHPLSEHLVQVLRQLFLDDTIDFGPEAIEDRALELARQGLERGTVDRWAPLPFVLDHLGQHRDLLVVIRAIVFRHRRRLRWPDRDSRSGSRDRGR